MSNYKHKDKKFAKTRLGLLDGFVELLGQKSFEEAKLTEICEIAGVSYATFFNYFNKKEDLLIYFIQLWSVEVSFEAKKIAKISNGLRAIEEVFFYTAKECEKNPKIMTEIISFQVKFRRELLTNIKPLTEVEKFIRFPYIEDFSDLGDRGIETVFPKLIEQAMESGELPKNTDVDALVCILASIFLGVPAALGPDNSKNYQYFYQQSLKLIWAGINKTGGVYELTK